MLMEGGGIATCQALSELRALGWGRFIRGGGGGGQSSQHSPRSQRACPRVDLQAQTPDLVITAAENKRDSDSPGWELQVRRTCKEAIRALAFELSLKEEVDVGR